MESISAFDHAVAKIRRDIKLTKTFTEEINLSVLAAYCEAQNHGNELLEFGYIWIWEINNIVDVLNGYKITQFTIHGNQQQMPEKLAAFQQFGFAITGIVSIFATSTDAGDAIAGHRPQVLAYKLAKTEN
jgi:phosphopentomutase